MVEVLIGLLGQGHILLPGLAKTLAHYHRQFTVIQPNQFTPDLLPADVVEP
jgi:hypothetical protein